MTDAAHEEVSVAAEPARCFALVAAFEGYPTWTNEVREVTVLARDDRGRATRVQYRAAALGRTIRYVLDYDYADAPASLSWSLVEGDVLRALDGRYGFETEDAGTRVTYDLRVDLSVPMPRLLKRRASAVIVGSALRDLKRAAEAPDDVQAETRAAAAPAAPEPETRIPVTPTEPTPPEPSHPEPSHRDANQVDAPDQHPESVSFDAAGSEPRSLPAPSVLESVLTELLGAVPEVRDHVLEAADALLDAAKALIDAAERVLRQQRAED